MLYAQFYSANAVKPSELIEACGDRSVIIYDSRVNRGKILDDAKQECTKRGYKAYALFHGESFTRSTRITSIQKVD